MKKVLFIGALILSNYSFANSCIVEVCDNYKRCTTTSVDKSIAYVGKRIGSYHEGGKSVTRRITRVISCRGVG